MIGIFFLLSLSAMTNYVGCEGLYNTECGEGALVSRFQFRILLDVPLVSHMSVVRDDVLVLRFQSGKLLGIPLVSHMSAMRAWTIRSTKKVY